jgi:CHRD domain
MPEPGRYLTPSTRNDRRRKRQARGRGLALLILVVVVAAAVVAWVVIFSDGKEPTISTSTSAKSATSTSTSVSPSPAATTSTSLISPTTTSSTPGTTNVTVTLRALLSGENETPAVATSASGTLTLTVAADGSSVRYVLSVSGLANLTLARLHEGKAGETGTTILTIYGGPTRSDVFSGVVTQGSFAADHFVGPLRGKSIADFVALVRSGSVYLNVGTTAHPLGEIRGQLE